MKTKTKTYLLLVAVIGIWATIGYKIVNGLNPSTPKIVNETFDTSFTTVAQKNQDTFSIKKMERDPFLGTLYLKKERKALKKIKKEAPLNIPSITYNGLIKKQDVTVFILNINNTQYLLKKGEIVDRVKLIRGDANKISIRYDNKPLTIKRQ